MKQILRAYKAFDSNLCCRGFQFEVGKEYAADGEIKICSNGFHACKAISDCYDYYPFDRKTRIAEVELSGKIETDGTKSVAEKIKILRELSWTEILDLCNTGIRNTGNRNTGIRNTGNRNTGDWNTGSRNTGDWNTGDWNTGNSNTGNSNTGDWNTGSRNTGDWNGCDFETGFFNPKSRPVKTVRVFGGMVVDRKDFINSCGYEVCCRVRPIFFRRGEKRYAMPYKAWWDFWASKLTRSERDAVKALPGFDADVFEEITGVRF